MLLLINTDVSPYWLLGNDMIYLVRNELIPITKDFFTKYWNIIKDNNCNNLRKIFLMYLRTSSFDIQDLKAIKYL